MMGAHLARHPNGRRGGAGRGDATAVRAMLAGLAALVAAGPWMTAYGGENPEIKREKTLSGRRFSDVIAQAFHGELAWTGDAAGDLAGGKHEGVGWVSLLHVGVAVDGTMVGLDRDSRLLLSALQINEGNPPSAALVGDVQGLDNDEASNATRVDQFWFWQAIPVLRLGVRAGLIDLNQYFDIMESAGILVNSSFGLSPGLSANAPVSTYPEPGYGAMMTFSFAGTTGLGIFQGDPARRSSVLRDGRYVIAEWKSPGAGSGNEKAAVKLGAWDCRCYSGSPRAFAHTWGQYAIVEFNVAERAGSPVGVFAQAALSPSAASTAPTAFAVGFTLPAPFLFRPDDILSIGATRQALRHRPAETAYEATYVIGFSDEVSVQPDVQYVVNPSGIYPDAWVFILRLHLQLQTDQPP